MRNGKNIDSEGIERWFKNGQIHRADGPACTFTNGNEMWYFEGLLHRLDGPAITYQDGDKAWYQNGLLHRTDGPAEMWIDGTMCWHFDGDELTESEFLILKEGIEFDEMMREMLTVDEAVSL